MPLLICCRWEVERVLHPWGRGQTWVRLNSSHLYWTDAETLKVHVQVGELSRSSSPAASSLPTAAGFGKRNNCSAPSPASLLLLFSSLFLSPRHLPLLSPSEAELVEVLALRSSNPRFNSVSKTTFFFFLSQPVETEMNGRGKRSGIFFSLLVKLQSIYFLFFLNLVDHLTCSVKRTHTLGSLMGHVLKSYPSGGEPLATFISNASKGNFRWLDVWCSFRASSGNLAKSYLLLVLKSCWMAKLTSLLVREASEAACCTTPAAGRRSVWLTSCESQSGVRKTLQCCYGRSHARVIFNIFWAAEIRQSPCICFAASLVLTRYYLKLPKNTA